MSSQWMTRNSRVNQFSVYDFKPMILHDPNKSAGRHFQARFWMEESEEKWRDPERSLVRFCETFLYTASMLNTKKCRDILRIV